LPPPPADGLHEDRKADLSSRAREIAVRHSRFEATGNDRHARRGDVELRLDLVAHQTDRGRRWSDEDDAVGGARVDEVRVLGKESVARMNRVGVGTCAGVKDPGDVQVALARRRRAEVERVIGFEHVAGAPVGVTEDGDRSDAQSTKGSNHPHRDLASIGDEDRVEHGAHIRKTP
jgi:hypothetical protein